MIRHKKITCFSLLLFIYFFLIDFGGIYAMEKTDEKIKQAMEESNPQQYEMNIILLDLDIKYWICPRYESGEIREPVDEPLGEYSPEKLKKYTDRDLEIKINYGFGCMWEGKHEDFIQSVRIYENGELLSCCYYVWSHGFVDDGGTRLKYPKIMQ